MTSLEKYTTRWAQEKRKSCKNCFKIAGYGFCRRHAPRAIMRTVRAPDRYQEGFAAGTAAERERVMKILIEMKRGNETKWTYDNALDDVWEKLDSLETEKEV